MRQAGIGNAGVFEVQFDDVVDFLEGGKIIVGEDSAFECLWGKQDANAIGVLGDSQDLTFQFFDLRDRAGFVGNKSLGE